MSFHPTIKMSPKHPSTNQIPTLPRAQAAHKMVVTVCCFAAAGTLTSFAPVFSSTNGVHAINFLKGAQPVVGVVAEEVVPDTHAGRHQDQKVDPQVDSVKTGTGPENVTAQQGPEAKKGNLLSSKTTHRPQDPPKKQVPEKAASTTIANLLSSKNIIKGGSTSKVAQSAETSIVGDNSTTKSVEVPQKQEVPEKLLTEERNSADISITKPVVAPSIINSTNIVPPQVLSSTDSIFKSFVEKFKLRGWFVYNSVSESDGVQHARIEEKIRLEEVSFDSTKIDSTYLSSIFYFFGLFATLIFNILFYSMLWENWADLRSIRQRAFAKLLRNIHTCSGQLKFQRTYNDQCQELENCCSKIKDADAFPEGLELSVLDSKNVFNQEELMLPESLVLAEPDGEMSPIAHTYSASPSKATFGTTDSIGKSAVLSPNNFKHSCTRSFPIATKGKDRVVKFQFDNIEEYSSNSEGSPTSSTSSFRVDNFAKKKPTPPESAEELWSGSVCRSPKSNSSNRSAFPNDAGSKSSV